MIRAKRPFDASKIKGIVFDKDGTLLDFHGTWMPKLRAAVSELANGDANVALTMLEIVGFDSHQNRVLGGSVLAAGDNRDISLIWAPLVNQSVDRVEALLNKMFEPSGNRPNETPSLCPLNRSTSMSWVASGSSR